MKTAGGCGTTMQLAGAGLVLLCGRALGIQHALFHKSISAVELQYEGATEINMQRPLAYLSAAIALSGAAGSILLSNCNNSGFKDIDLFGGQILDVDATPLQGLSIGIDNGGGLPPGNFSNLDFCNITVTYTRPGRHDRIHVYAALPLRNWNDRFLAVGGGGWRTGYPAEYLVPAVARGYAVASTDGGHSVYNQSAASWALNSPGNADLNLLQDFASVALNDVSIIGKQLVASFYGRSAKASYWRGCSTGGRQGLMLAQRYPQAFDGIVAVAPAINWVQFLVAEYWPQYVMNQHNYYPPSCEFEAIANASVRACDELDGVEDGIISDPFSCHFDAETLAGQSFDCNEATRAYSLDALKIANAVWSGPHGSTSQRYSWYGLTRGASFSGLAGTVCPGEHFENCTGSPFAVSEEWIKYFVMKNADFNPSNITRSHFFDIFHKSVQEYDSIIGTSDPDLSAFNHHGGKMITWHGLADQLIFPQGTRTYYDRVLKLDPHAKDFYRFYEAPGVAHCSGGLGPAPETFATLDDLIKWVEHGEAPETLTAISQTGGDTMRPLCAYPKQQKYVGGDPNDEHSFRCSDP